MLTYLIVGIFLMAVAFWLAHYFLKANRGHAEPSSAVWEAFGFGAVAVVIAIFLQTPFHINGTFLALQAGAFNLTDGAVTHFMIAGIEEVAKFLPLAFLIYWRPYFSNHEDGVIYFSLSGLCFSLVENVLYMMRFGPEVALLRTGLILFLHPAATGIVGYYFAQAKLSGEHLGKTLAALAAVTVMHGLYNFGLSYSSTNLGWFLLSIMMTATLNIGLFWYWRRAIRQDQLAGLASVEPKAI
jgi:protease PrsW